MRAATPKRFEQGNVRGNTHGSEVTALDVRRTAMTTNQYDDEK